MSRRRLLFFFLLLAVPTLLVAAAAFRMLRHEQERVARQVLTAQDERLRAVAESVQLAVATVEDEVADQLRALPPAGLTNTLLAWQESNPLIRHVFVWEARTGLQYPRMDPACTADERRFISRYDALFNGRVPWRSDATEGPAPALAAPEAPEPPAAQSVQQASMVEQVLDLRRSGRKMAQEARRRESAPPAVAALPGGETGWLPWLTENQLSLLGWARTDGGLIYGVEIEFTALLSRIVVAFPRAVPRGSAYAILDDSGRIVHHAGDVEVAPGLRPVLSASLAPYLPHWQVAAYFPGGVPGARMGKTYLLLAGMLLAAFVVTILTGGLLLIRIAHRNALDALQKTTFVSNVSHELKTPLTSIRMYAELLGRDRVRDPDKRARYLAVIVEESERLTRLVNNVLDFSRLEQRRKAYHAEDVDLPAFVRGFADAHRLRIESAGLALHVRVPDTACTVRIDRDSLEQALLNLVDNAVKYAAEGRELGIELRADGGGARLTVCDRGPGVGPRHRARIFEKFYRADDSVTARQPGAGLGLSIARALLRDQGADLTHEPREGGGSCFVIQFPGGTIAAGPASR